MAYMPTVEAEIEVSEEQHAKKNFQAEQRQFTVKGLSELLSFVDDERIVCISNCGTKVTSIVTLDDEDGGGYLVLGT